MTKLITTLLFSLTLLSAFGQSLDAPFSKNKMKKDLEVFKEIRLKANSGLHKYRTEAQIDSLYNWANAKVDHLNTYGEFYNLICTLTDYEGSLHNDTSISNKKWQQVRRETSGYFPFPLKWVDGNWVVNFDKGEIPLGAQIISINGIAIDKIVSNVYKYYTTDGQNLTGKRIGLRTHFSRYYRLHYGRSETFDVVYKAFGANANTETEIKSISYKNYYEHFENRYSKPFDQVYYDDRAPDENYTYKTIDSQTGILTLHSFSLGDKNSSIHKRYASFLDSLFIKINEQGIENLIVDVRQNGGGTDSNDLITYSYLTDRNFQENRQAWISFYKIPMLRYYNSKVPAFLRPLGVGKYNKDFQKAFPVYEGNGYFQNDESADHRVWTPNDNAFTGNIYLLVGPATASAASLFAAMVAGNDNTITIGEETMGGYYGHNGHTPLSYKLPNSKLVTTFSVVNLEQDVPQKSNQIYDRGIIPDYDVPQTYKDFISQEDTQLHFTLALIKKNESKDINLLKK